ncbi:hypothetical protein [Streptomyces sp. NPDC048669]|uniref:hypothetical protein n=1 Tax=Streptomyces sp. NPDC048669 TaxID=3155267 RepID=UPI00342F122F
MTANPIEHVEAAAAQFMDWKREAATTTLSAGLVDEHHLVDPLDHVFEAIPLAHPELIPDSNWTPGGTR